MRKAIVKLIDLKSILMIIFSWYLGLLLCGKWEPTDTVLALFISTFSSMVTYYFTKRRYEEAEETEEAEEAEEE